MSDDTWSSIVTFVGNELLRKKELRMDIETFGLKFGLTGEYEHEMLMRLDRSAKKDEKVEKPPFTFHTEPKGHQGNPYRAIIFTSSK